MDRIALSQCWTRVLWGSLIWFSAVMCSVCTHDIGVDCEHADMYANFVSNLPDLYLYVLFMYYLYKYTSCMQYRSIQKPRWATFQYSAVGSQVRLEGILRDTKSGLLSASPPVRQAMNCAAARRWPSLQVGHAEGDPGATDRAEVPRAANCHAGEGVETKPRQRKDVQLDFFSHFFQ